jgi:hypothetical protein
MMNDITIPRAINKLNTIPENKPINAPIDARKAWLESLWVRNSPIKAPKKGPIIIPKGGNKNSPRNKPSIAPMLPNFPEPK